MTTKSEIICVARITDKSNETIIIGIREVEDEYEDPYWEVVLDNMDESGIEKQKSEDDAIDAIEKKWGYEGNPWNFRRLDLEADEFR